VNRLILAAEVVERGATRYTPAGLPALDLMLKHQSQVTEDGQPRQIAMQLKAVAIGAITRPVAALALGTPAQFAGFLTASRNGKGLVFHVTELDT